MHTRTGYVAWPLRWQCSVQESSSALALCVPSSPSALRAGAWAWGSVVLCLGGTRGYQPIANHLMQMALSVACSYMQHHCRLTPSAGTGLGGVVPGAGRARGVAARAAAGPARGAGRIQTGLAGQEPRPAGAAAAAAAAGPGTRGCVGAAAVRARGGCQEPGGGGGQYVGKESAGAVWACTACSRCRRERRRSSETAWHHAPCPWAPWTPACTCNGRRAASQLWCCASKATAARTALRLSNQPYPPSHPPAHPTAARMYVWVCAPAGLQRWLSSRLGRQRASWRSAGACSSWRPRITQWLPCWAACRRRWRWRRRRRRRCGDGRGVANRGREGGPGGDEACGAVARCGSKLVRAGPSLACSWGSG